jgi:RHS repeat-associated protein
VDQGGALLERVEYDSYGQAQHHWPEGITGAAGGGVVSADATAAAAAENKSIGDSLYNSDADLNRNGTVSSAEVAAIAAKVGTAGIPAGRISAYGSTVGWCGYAFNAGTNLYTVRFRHYEPANGVARWLERDPAGYMDGASLYMYGGLLPTIGSDPSGRFVHVLIGAAGGAFIGGGISVVSDLMAGKPVDWGRAVQHAAAGAVGGALAGATGGLGLLGIWADVAAGAAYGLGSGLTEQWLNWEAGGSFDLGDVVISTAAGGLGGGAIGIFFKKTGLGVMIMRRSAAAGAAGTNGAAIGRSMLTRVIPTAEREGLTYFTPSARDLPYSQLLRENQNWLKQMMRQGKWIYDRGEPLGMDPSPFYNWEREFIRRVGYTRYRCIGD